MMLALAIWSSCQGATAEVTEPSGCTPEYEALMNEAQEAPWGDLVAYAAVTNYSQGFLATYMAFQEGPAACSAPKAVGLEVSKAALETLPGVDEVQNQPPPSCLSNPFAPGCFLPNDMVFLPFFENLGAFNPFTVMEFDWNPAGHEPPGVYTSPHMDFHFYLIPQEQVMNITAGPCANLSPDSFTAANQPVPEQCFPGGAYVNLGATVPAMGNHYLDMEAPEMRAMMAGEDGTSTWNQTWIWGGLDGQIVFFEAMITRSYLESEPDACHTIPGMPSAFAIAGFKPHTYCILSSPDSIRVELRDFSWYDAGCGEEAMMAPASYAAFPPGSNPLPDMCVYPQA